MLMSEVEIITDGGRRRRWSSAEKLRIVEETPDGSYGPFANGFDRCTAQAPSPEAPLRWKCEPALPSASHEAAHPVSIGRPPNRPVPFG
ncbi:hypothetical protein DDZ14_03970 [Maritimibacter sp. 55A14]|nr:hypothetical protein DDZ14_03970 [Maritimibacter sp. 55A14]